MSHEIRVRTLDRHRRRTGGPIVQGESEREATRATIGRLVEYASGEAREAGLVEAANVLDVALFQLFASKFQNDGTAN